MLLILFFILLLLQVLYAIEFPNLMDHIKITWDYETLTRQVNARQTMSIDGQVPVLILCGPFQTSGDDGKCKLNYSYQYQPSPTTKESGLGSSQASAKFLSTINQTYSCISFESKIRDFADLYKRTEQDPYNNEYDISYECETIHPDPVMPMSTVTIVFLSAIAVFVLIGVRFCAYKCGERKSKKISRQNAKSYRGFGAKNSSAVYGGTEPYGGKTN